MDNSNYDPESYNPFEGKYYYRRYYDMVLSEAT